MGYEPAPEHVEQFDDLVDRGGENVVTGRDVAAKYHPLRCPSDVPLQPAGEPDQSIQPFGLAHLGLVLDEPADAAVAVVDDLGRVRVGLPHRVVPHGAWIRIVLDDPLVKIDFHHAPTQRHMEREVPQPGR